MEATASAPSETKNYLAPLNYLPTDLSGKPPVAPEVRAEIREELRQRKHQFKKGGWNGGGGSGVACFENAVVANNAIDASGHIREEFISQISELKTLDLWEAEKLDFHFLKFDDQQSAREYVMMALEKLVPIVPQFASHAKAALDLVRPEKWTSDISIPRLLDEGPSKLVPPRHCKKVQLVVRYSKTADDHFPQAFVDAHPRLLEKMRNQKREVSLLSEATILLHEALYLLGVEMNHDNSLSTRQLTVFILSKELHEWLENFPVGIRAIKFISVLGRLGFDHYMRLFTASTQSQRSDIQKSNLQSRIQSQKFLSEQVDEAMWYAAGTRFIPDAKIYFQTSADSKRMSQKMMWYFARNLTQESAFLYLSFTLFRIGKVLLSNETLVDPRFDQKLAVSTYCEQLTIWRNTEMTAPEGKSNVDLISVLEMAHSYCASSPY